MKRSFLIASLVALLSGCTYTSQVNTGNPYSQQKIAQIEKGKTTEQELVLMFGQPAMKTVLNEHDVKWVYSYMDGSTSAQAFTMKTTSNMVQHTLDILIRDGIVLNHAETNTPYNYNITNKTSL